MVVITYINVPQRAIYDVEVNAAEPPSWLISAGQQTLTTIYGASRPAWAEVDLLPQLAYPGAVRRAFILGKADRFIILTELPNGHGVSRKMGSASSLDAEDWGRDNA